MAQDKKSLYILLASSTAGLLSLLWVDSRICIPLSAVWLVLSAVVACLLLRKRQKPSLHRNAVLLLTVVFVLLYFTLFYISGLFLGYVKTTVPFSMNTLLHRILPISLTIIASELLRRVLLSQESRTASVLAFLLCILGEVAMAGGLLAVSSFHALMDMVGLTLIPAITTGFLCHYASARYGVLSCICYRLIMALLPFFIPVTPDLPDALLSFFSFLLPLFLLLFLRALFEKRVKRATTSPAVRRIARCSAVIGLCLATAFIALISCRFQYGAIVIATGSMTGELNVGDAIIYEQYDGQQISEGDIIVFERNRSLIVHRVVEITHINGVTRYYTKGDANENRDVGFLTSSDIVGITNFKIAYIGHPSLWVRNLFTIGS